MSVEGRFQLLPPDARKLTLDQQVTASCESYAAIQELISQGVTSLIVHQAQEPDFDYGHSDLFLADDARDLVWQPILNWIETR